MRKKEVVKVFSEDILPGIRTKELRATYGSRSYKDGVYVDPRLRCTAWHDFVYKLEQAGVKFKLNQWDDEWRTPGCCYSWIERGQLKYYTKAGLKRPQVSDSKTGCPKKV